MGVDILVLGWLVLSLLYGWWFGMFERASPEPYGSAVMLVVSPFALSFVTTVLALLVADRHGIHILRRMSFAAPSAPAVAWGLIAIGGAAVVVYGARRVLPRPVTLSVLAALDRLVDGTRILRAYRRRRAGHVLQTMLDK